MNPDTIVSDTQSKLAQAVERFQDELKTLRTGRANPTMLDGITVEAYGTPMPLKQVASIAAPEAQLLQVTPFDPNNLEAIAAAIRNDQGLGLNPSDDGHIVRVTIPPLTEERRRELAKQIGAKQEECMIRLRAIRHDALNAIDKLKKDKELGEDDAKRLTARIEEAMSQTRKQAEEAARAKEADILTL